jgi:hypothetical protein
MERAAMKKLKFTRSWRGYRTGQVVEIPGGLATQLLAQRVAVEDRQQELETAAIDHQAETADATPRKRGRPRAVPKPDPTDRPSR